MEILAGKEAERRTSRRVEAPELRVTLLADNGQPLDPETELVDLSARGLGLQTRAPFKPGEKVRFTLDLPGGPVGGLAEMRWTIPHRRGYRCGAHIERMGWLHARKLRDYLHPGSDPLRAVDGLLGAVALALAVLFLLDVLGVSSSTLVSRLAGWLAR